MKRMATAVFMSLLTGTSGIVLADTKGEPVHIKSMDAKTLEVEKKKAEAEGKTVEVINQVEPTKVKEKTPQKKWKLKSNY